MKGWLVSLVISVLVGLPVWAQDEFTAQETGQEQGEDSLWVPQDSLEAAVDTTAPAATPEGITKKKSVGMAMLLSAVLPGGGQFYNQRYHKGGWIAGAELALGALTVGEHLLMLEVQESWSVLPDSVRVEEWEYHRARRNMFAFFTGAVIAYAVADAYVDAHMFGFREQQRLTLTPSRNGLGLVFLVNF